MQMFPEFFIHVKFTVYFLVINVFFLASLFHSYTVYSIIKKRCTGGVTFIRAESGIGERGSSSR